MQAGDGDEGGGRGGFEGGGHIIEIACPDLQACPEEARPPHHLEGGEKGMKWEQRV